MREILKYLGWSQSKLAGRVGYDPNTVSRWVEVPRAVSAYLLLVESCKRSWEDVR